MESSRKAGPDDTIEIREGLVRDLYRVVAPMGIVSFASSSLRNWVAGIEHNPLPLLAMVAGVVVVWIFERRISWKIRGAVILSTMMVGGLDAASYLGVAAPGLFFLPTGVVLAWIVLGPRAAALAASLGGGLFAFLAWDYVTGRSRSAIDEMDINRLPLFWAQSAIVQGIVVVLIVLVLRRLFQLNQIRQRSLAKEKDRVAGILEGIQEALFVLRMPDGRIIETNRSAEEMFRATREDLLRSASYEYSANTPPWTRVEAAEHIQRALVEGPQQFLWKSRRADGTLFWSEIAIRALRLEDDTQLLITIRDVEERVQDKLELERLNSELEARVARRTATIEESRQELQAFSYAVSHDLRAPLRAIDGFARVLAEDHADDLPDDAKASLNRILAGANRMNRLIDALLDLSRIDRKPYRRIPVDMDRIVAELREELAAGGTGDRPTVEWRIGNLLPCETDPDLVRQIWANLLGNAVKFAGETPRPSIEVVSQERADGIWYEVRDNGSGFDMAHSRNLFGMFQRLHDASTDGLGIGLATVRRILRRLDGEIEFESVPGEGATFRFRPGPSRWDETSRDLPET